MKQMITPDTTFMDSVRQKAHEIFIEPKLLLIGIGCVVENMTGQEIIIRYGKGLLSDMQNQATRQSLSKNKGSKEAGLFALEIANHKDINALRDTNDFFVHIFDISGVPQNRFDELMNFHLVAIRVLHSHVSKLVKVAKNIKGYNIIPGEDLIPYCIKIICPDLINYCESLATLFNSDLSYN